MKDIQIFVAKETYTAICNFIELYFGKKSPHLEQAKQDFPEIIITPIVEDE